MLKYVDIMTWILFHTVIPLSYGNPPVTVAFPSVNASHAEISSFLCCEPEQAAQKRNDLRH